MESCADKRKKVVSLKKCIVRIGKVGKTATYATVKICEISVQ